MKKFSFILLIVSSILSSALLLLFRLHPNDSKESPTSVTSKKPLIALDAESRHEDIAFNYPSALLSVEEYGRAGGGWIVISDGTSAEGSSMTIYYPVNESFEKLKSHYDIDNFGEGTHQGVAVSITTDQGLSGYRISYDNELGEAKGYAYLIQAPKTRLSILHATGKYDDLFEHIINSIHR